MITGTVTGDDKVLARFSGLSQTLRAALIDSMKRQWFRIQAETVTGKLSGDPLHRRTGNLASSINVGGSDSTTSFDEGDGEIVGRIGTRVRYAKYHEYGGTFDVPEYTRKMTSKTGKAIVVRAHTVTFKERSFLRSTLNEMRGSVIAAIEADIARATKEA